MIKVALKNVGRSNSFRHDIHGMRGISALLVVLFHFGVPGFSGGFLGVDIFFVISGYLITMLLLSDAENHGRFSLRRFYLRRLKRILPAALIVLLVFGFIGAWLLPSKAPAFAEEMRWNAVALGNVFYGAQSNYFASSSEEFLFLNYWSLGIEEQFYLLWPMILILGLKLKREHQMFGCFGLALTLVIMTSFAWSLDSSSLGFYQLTGRVWELAAGGGLAILERRWKALNSLRSKLRVAGVFLVLLALVGEQFSVSPHALVSMALVVFGTLSFIAAGNDKGSFILSISVLQFFGSISYSLYLVHWPLKTIAFLYVSRPLLPAELLVCFLASVILSVIVHYGVENPIRFKRWRAKGLTFSSAISLSTLVAVSYSISVLPKIFHSNTTELFSEYNEVRGRLQKTCLTSVFPGVETCQFGAKGRQKIDFWLVGDSHAEHWQAGLEDLALRHNLSGVMYAKNTRLPIFGMKQVLYRKENRVEEDSWRDDFKNDLMSAEPATVILSARWGLYSQTKSSGPDGDKRYYVVKTSSDEHSIEVTQKIISKQLEQTVRDLQSVGHKVVLLGQIPELGVSKLDCVTRAGEDTESKEACYPQTADVAEFLEPSKNILQGVADKTGAVVIFPDQNLCSVKNCVLMDRNTFLYRDDDHMNKRGSVIVANRLAVKFLSVF